MSDLLHPATPTFLAADATPARILQALAANMREHIVSITLAGGGEVHQEHGVTWTYMMDPSGEALLAFPQLDVVAAGAQLDAILGFYRQRQPLRQVICWSLHPPQPPDLEARLLARGFEGNWQPHWMWLNFAQLPDNTALPQGLRIAVQDEQPIWDINDIPYYNRASSMQQHARGQAHVPRIWHFAAWLHERLVGHCVLSLTTGELGVAGIFDVGVVPTARNLGIGKALTLAACQFARQQGCHHAILNATPMGEPVYRRLGFVSLGHGRTWLISERTLLAAPATTLQVALVEAVGRGDLATLDQLTPRISSASLNACLPNNFTLLQIAARLQQAAAAEWLVKHNVTLDVLSAWDLGWHERVKALLQAQPEWANMRSGSAGITPLHSAAERGDTEFARVLLSANPNLTLTDNQFHSTALGWANHFQRTEIVQLIEQQLQA